MAAAMLPISSLRARAGISTAVLPPANVPIAPVIAFSGVQIARTIQKTAAITAPNAIRNVTIRMSRARPAVFSADSLAALAEVPIRSLTFDRAFSKSSKVATKPGNCFSAAAESWLARSTIDSALLI
jgi:hypothetical protein